MEQWAAVLLTCAQAVVLILGAVLLIRLCRRMSAERKQNCDLGSPNRRPVLAPARPDPIARVGGPAPVAATPGLADAGAPASLSPVPMVVASASFDRFTLALVCLLAPMTVFCSIGMWIAHVMRSDTGYFIGGIPVFHLAGILVAYMYSA